MKIKNLKNNLAIFGAVVSLLFFGVGLAKANEELESQIINYANQERAAGGVEQLVKSDILDEVAKLKARDMLGNDYFAHTSPQGLNPWHWFDRAGYSYKFAGENLGMDFETAFAVHGAWMKSETHRENILSTKYKEIGVAVERGIIGNKETQVAVQVFGTSLREGDPVPVNSTKDTEATINEDGVIIAQSSFHFWRGGEVDELLVSAEVSGDPQEVTAIIGNQEYELENLKGDVYVNLISLKDETIKEENILIKAVGEDKKAVFGKIPDKYFAEYMIEKDEKTKEKSQVVAMLNSDQNPNNLVQKTRLWFSQTGFMLLIAGLFIITIFNIWVLEREEERLLEMKQA